MEKWNQHIGVYGIHIDDNRLLVVKKTRGPYIYRFDLPGGSFDPNESIYDCLRRELREEIGYDFDIINAIGTYDYLIPWQQENNATHVHHISMFYNVKPKTTIESKIQIADDTEGYEFVDFDTLTIKNSSPLVLDIVDYYTKNKIKEDLKSFDDWDILAQPHD